MKSPSTSAVRITVSIAARLGAALRVSARSASFRKKPKRIRWPTPGRRARGFAASCAGAAVGGRPSLVGMALDADAELAAQADRELPGGLVGPVEAGHLVADDPALGQLDH